MNCVLLVTVMLLCVAAHASSMRSSQQAAPACQDLEPTLYFAYECSDLNVHNTWCFYDAKTGDERAPNVNDVLAFNNSYGVITMSFSFLYTPLTVKAVLLTSGNTLSMQGGAIQVTDCFYVAFESTLELSALNQLDTGAASTTVFLPDGAVTPKGTGCAAVPQGFTPRLCGPGVLQVDGAVYLMGLYASLFAPVVLSSSASLSIAPNPPTEACTYKGLCAPFIWGDVTNNGQISAISDLFLHGSITNNKIAQLQAVRADVWSQAPRVATPVLIVNNANLQFGPLDILSIGSLYNADILSPAEAGTVQYKLKLVNNKGATATFMYTNGLSSSWYAGMGADVFNYGSVSWVNDGKQAQAEYTNKDSFVNSGVVSADGALVSLNDYLSQGGTSKTSNGGSFYFGNGAGADTKTAVMCKRAKEPEVPEQKKIGSFVRAKKEVRMASRTHKKAHSVTGVLDHSRLLSNATASVQCNYELYPGSGCADPTLCCGSSGVCEPGNCCWYGGPHSLSGSFGTPGCEVACCPNNAGCFVSSHGPYCGSDVFIWDVDVECFENLEFVDRYDYEVMKKQFVLLDLPKFGKNRYSFRGKSFVTGDGTGGVHFTEPIEIDGELVVADGGSIVSLIDSGMPSFVGNGRLTVGKGGTHVAGIRSAFTEHTPRVVVEAGGSFVVPPYSTTMVHAAASFQMHNMSALVVDGQFISMPDGSQNAKICANVRGKGALVGETLC